MIPILYQKNETNFNHNGIGKLKEASLCMVTEERNGVYELELNYPVSGKYTDEIIEDAYIVCEPAPGKPLQRFRIYKVTLPKSGNLTAYAYHISYQLSFIPIKKFDANGIDSVLRGLKTNSAIDNPFSFETDITSSSYWYMDSPKDCKSCLRGSEGSILDIFGGEYEFDNYTVRLLRNRGVKSGITLSYGNNITDISKDLDISSMVSGLLPYVVNNGVVTYGDIVYSGIETSYPKVITEDVSSFFDMESTPSLSQITNAGRQALNNKILSSVENLKVSFVPVWESEASKERMQKLYLCDSVRVRYGILNIDREMKVIKTVYNALLGRYDSIELGEPRTIITTLIRETIDEVSTEFKSETGKIRQEFKASEGELLSKIEEVEGDVTKKYSRLTQDINGLSIEVGQIDSELGDAWAAITVNSNSISSKVSKNGIISAINQSAESVTIDASRINLNGVTSIQKGAAKVQVDGNELRFYINDYLRGGIAFGGGTVAIGYTNRIDLNTEGGKAYYNGKEIATV